MHVCVPTTSCKLPIYLWCLTWHRLRDNVLAFISNVLHVRSTCTFYMYILHVRSTCTFYMYVLHVRQVLSRQVGVKCCVKRLGGSTASSNHEARTVSLEVHTSNLSKPYQFSDCTYFDKDFWWFVNKQSCT